MHVADHAPDRPVLRRCVTTAVTDRSDRPTPYRRVIGEEEHLEAKRRDSMPLSRDEKNPRLKRLLFVGGKRQVSAPGCGAEAPCPPICATRPPRRIAPSERPVPAPPACWRLRRGHCRNSPPSSRTPSA